MTPAGTFLVARPEDLDRIGGWSARRVRRIAIDTRDRRPLVDRVERLSRAINRDLRACGCIEGAVACASAMAAAPLLGTMIWSRLPSSRPALIGILFGYLIAAALVGKICGIVLAERRLSRNVRALRAVLAARASGVRRLG